MLRDEVEQYSNLTGEDGWHVPLMKVGAYLDGYNKGLEVLDKLRTEIKLLQNMCTENNLKSTLYYSAFGMVLDIIDECKTEKENN